VPGAGLPWQALRLGAAIGGGLMALAVTASVLGVDAFHEAVEMIQTRVRKSLGK